MNLRELINKLEEVSENGRNDNLPVFLFGVEWHDEVEDAVVEPDCVELI